MPRKTSPHVPEQLRGFSAQETRMAALLLEAPTGSYVSLEKLDDVAQENADNTVLAIQSKDCEATNPVSDRSVQMWKTFANWSRDVAEHQLDPSRTTFEIYVSRKVSGKLVAAFASAKSKTSANDAFNTARSLLWGDGPKFSKKSEVAETLRPHLEEVFDVSPRAFRAIIERFQLTCALKNPELDLFALIRSRMAFEPDDLVLEVVVDVYGWVKKLVADELRKRKAPVIGTDDFMRLLRGSYARLKPGGSLPDLGGKGPTPSEVAKLMCEQFVRQIDIINAEEQTRNRAIACLFKARTARTKWSDRGAALVHNDDVQEFEDGLMQVWQNTKTEVFSDPLRTDEELRGRLLLAKCESHTRKVEQKDVPDYFIPGCFHDLADRLLLGWHPRFNAILSQQDSL
jgi:hypothetical protein